MSPHALAQPWKVVPCVHLTQFGHQGALTAFEKVRLNATSTMFQSQTSQPSTPALLAPSLSYVLLFLTLSKSTNPYAPKVNFVNLYVRFANYRGFP